MVKPVEAVRMTSMNVEAPVRLGSREQATKLLAGLSLDLTGQTIVVSFRDNLSARPSFVDELVRELLFVRGARCLVLKDAPELVRSTAQRSAVSRDVESRLHIT
jgi:hypothetical protein